MLCLNFSNIFLNLSITYILGHTACCLDLPNLFSRLGSLGTMGHTWLMPKHYPCKQLACKWFKSYSSAKPNLHLILVTGHRADLAISPSALYIQLNRLSLIMALDCLILYWFWMCSSNASKKHNRHWMGGVSLLAHFQQLQLSPEGISWFQQ